MARSNRESSELTIEVAKANAIDGHILLFEFSLGILYILKCRNYLCCVSFVISIKFNYVDAALKTTKDPNFVVFTFIS